MLPLLLKGDIVKICLVKGGGTAQLVLHWLAVLLVQSSNHWEERKMYMAFFVQDINAWIYKMVNLQVYTNWMNFRLKCVFDALWLLERKKQIKWDRIHLLLSISLCPIAIVISVLEVLLYHWVALYFSSFGLFIRQINLFLQDWCVLTFCFCLGLYHFHLP
jgi:hypothetical protein